MVTPKQKTWTDLLGPYQEGDMVQGCYIVRPTGANTFRTLYRCIGDSGGHYAKEIFELWKEGK